MREMFGKLLNEDKEMTKQKNNQDGIRFTFVLFLAFYILVFGAFTIISIVSLISLRPPDNTFFYTQSAKQILNEDLFPDRKYLNVDEYQEDIVHKLKGFFPSNINGTVLDQTVFPITGLRIGLVSNEII